MTVLGATSGAHLGPGEIESQNNSVFVVDGDQIDFVGASSVVDTGSVIQVTIPIGAQGPPGAGPPGVSTGAYPTIATTIFTPKWGFGVGIQTAPSGAPGSEAFLAFCQGVGVQHCVYGGDITPYTSATHFGGGYVCTVFSAVSFTVAAGAIFSGRMTAVGG